MWLSSASGHRRRRAAHAPGGASAPTSSRHFQHATARTDFVLGEFPWRVRVGEEVVTDDFISPPLMLSSEGSANERTWSLGRYTDPETIREAFALPVSPPPPVGIFANQPNPRAGRLRPMMLAFAVLAALLVVVALGRLLTADRETVFGAGYTFTPGVAESSFVTAPFTLSDAGTVEIGLTAPVQQFLARLRSGARQRGYRRRLQRRRRDQFLPRRRGWRGVGGRQHGQH